MLLYLVGLLSCCNIIINVLELSLTVIILFFYFMRRWMVLTIQKKDFFSSIKQTTVYFLDSFTSHDLSHCERSRQDGRPSNTVLV